MNPDEGHSTFDRDLDVPRRLAAWPDDSEAKPYYRLVVNPFLAILGWLVALSLFRLALHRRHLPLAIAAFATFVISFYLFQFHCLDCGKTDFLLRRSRHRCDAVWARWHTQTLSRWRMPSVTFQLVLWFYLISTALFLYATLFRPRR